MKNACKPATKARANQRRLLFGSTAISLCVGLLAAVPVRADTTPSVLPQGGAVVAGQASIVASGQQLTINQSSARAIVNWNSFSVGQPNSVQFNQPNAQAATLNRVTGATPSTIAGEIRGNGQVYHGCWSWGVA